MCKIIGEYSYSAVLPTCILALPTGTKNTITRQKNQNNASELLHHCKYEIKILTIQEHSASLFRLQVYHYFVGEFCMQILF